VLRDQRGMTIIETTVILAVMFILAGAMSPIVSESVGMARAVKAKNDASMIAIGLINFKKDIGADAATFGTAGPATAIGLPDVLETGGNAPSVDDVDTGDETADDPALLQLLAPSGEAGGRENRAAARAALRAKRQAWRAVRSEALNDHLMNNRRGYRYRRAGEYGGWNGPYISAEIKGDPWGNKYLVNTRWLDGGASVADAEGRPRHAVFVISSGYNGTIETPFEQPLVDARAYGDDIVIRIQ
jgi:type II secretory pathway pseudopilin PulG